MQALVELTTETFGIQSVEEVTSTRKHKSDRLAQTLVLWFASAGGEHLVLALRKYAVPSPAASH